MAGDFKPSIPNLGEEGEIELISSLTANNGKAGIKNNIDVLFNGEYGTHSWGDMLLNETYHIEFQVNYPVKIWAIGKSAHSDGGGKVGEPINLQKVGDTESPKTRQCPTDNEWYELTDVLDVGVYKITAPKRYVSWDEWYIEIIKDSAVYIKVLDGYININDDVTVTKEPTEIKLPLQINIIENFVKQNYSGKFSLEVCTEDMDVQKIINQTTHELNLLQDDLLQADKIQLLNWFENEESVELGVNGVLNSKFTSIIEAKSSEQVGKIVATDNNQGTKYLISTDKENWQRWNGTQWETVSWQNKDEINTLGMSKNTLKDITETQWQALGETFYLGLYLHNHNAIIEKIDFQELVPDKTPEVSSASLYILNTQAEIDITMTGNKLLGKITDSDKGKVQYRIVLNNEALYPEDGVFTPLLPEPQHINMRIPSNKINIGESNTIRIEFQDAWGSIDTWSRTFIGELNGLLFFDEMNELYSDELGNVLKPLDFGDIITGQISTSSQIKFKNTLGHEITNVTLKADWGVDEEGEPNIPPAGVVLEFSKSDSPFLPLNQIDLGEKIMEHEEEYIFYVRLKTTLGMTPSVSGSVKICARAEDVKEAFKS